MIIFVLVKMMIIQYIYIDVSSEEWFHNILIESLSMLFEQAPK
jgi:hypothetical protein